MQTWDDRVDRPNSSVTRYERRLSPEGVLLLSIEQIGAEEGGGVCRFEPPVLLYEPDLSVGASWQQTTKCLIEAPSGDTYQRHWIDGARVDAVRTVEVGGVPREVVEIRRKRTDRIQLVEPRTLPAHSEEWEEVEVYSPALGLTVSREGTVGPRSNPARRQEFEITLLSHD